VLLELSAVGVKGGFVMWRILAEAEEFRLTA
jgi:hypothetical protein